MNTVLRYLLMLGIFTGYMPSGLAATESLKSTAPALTMTDFFQVFAGLLFVLALFLGMAWLFRRLTGYQPSGNGNLKIVDGLHIGHRERLLLINCYDRQLLLSVTPGRIEHLETLEVPVESRSPQAKEKQMGFPGLLQQTQSGGKVAG